MTKNIIFIVVATAIIAGIFFLESRKTERGNETKNIFVNDTSVEEKSKRYAGAIEISSPDGFINTDSKNITIGELIGKKVILLDIWTYSCINCQRTIPYLNSWYEKYEDDGLVIIGLHTPEFDFEKKYENVVEAVKKFGIKFPVVLDNDFSTWTAYGNRYWPRKYLIDIDGFVVYDHIGEGAYEETEKKIQELLAERKVKLKEGELVEHDLTEEEVILQKPQSPEVYFGASRNEFLGNGQKATVGVQSFFKPKIINSNSLYFEGDFNIEREYAEPVKKKSKIIFRYTGNNVFMVASSEIGSKIKIINDGEVVSTEAGFDVKDGIVSILEPRLYKLIEGAGAGEHTLEIEVLEGVPKFFTFTFGS